MSLTKVESNLFTPSIYAKAPNSPIPLHPNIPNLSFSNLNWKERSIEQIDKWDERLEEIIPNFFLQKKIDEWCLYVESLFSPFYEFNIWLNSNGEGNWNMQLATFLAKLPIRSARNIFRLFYEVIQTTLYTTIHPLKAVNLLSKRLIQIIDELEKPESWAQIGTGTTGTLIGQCWIARSPISIIGIGIAGAMALTGISIASLQASLKEQKGLLKLKSLSTKLPETFLTGVLMGILTGSISKKPQKKLTTKSKKNRIQTSISSTNNETIDEFIKQNNLPPYSKLIVDKNGKMTILWDSQEALQIFAEKHPRFFKTSELSDFRPLDVTISLSDPIPRMDFHYSYTVYTYDGYDPWIYTTTATRTKLLRKYFIDENIEISKSL